MCINCIGANPIFNMYTKTCTSCPDDTTINTDTKTCEQTTHYTNYTAIENWALDGASSLPTVNSSLSPCKIPLYWNGSCVICKLPSFWSVQDNKCKKCPKGQVFDIN